jgi:hypothetical protein
LEEKIMKRVHHDLIVAWAAGAKIQICVFSVWEDIETPSWDHDLEYRIKPEPKPNYVELTSLYQPDGYEWKHLGFFRVTFNGDTKKVLSVEVINNA